MLIFLTAFLYFSNSFAELPVVPKATATGVVTAVAQPPELYDIIRKDNKLKEIELVQPVAKAYLISKEENTWKLRFEVRVQGLRDWSLGHKENYFVIKSDDQKIPLGFKLNKPIDSIALYLLGPKGEPLFETFYFKPQVQAVDESKVLAAQEAGKTEAGARPPSTVLNVKLSVSSLSYTDNAGFAFTSFALTPGLNFRTPFFWKPLVFNFSAFMTGVHLLPSNAYASSARFFGINLRLGYTLPWFRGRWRVSVFPGWYFTSMLVSGNAFGFQNVSGPQLYPTILYTRANRTTIFGYLKFSPILNGGLNFLDLSSHEQAIGIGYGWKTKGKRDLNVSIDIAQIVISNFLSTNITTSSASLGFGYTF